VMCDYYSSSRMFDENGSRGLELGRNSGHSRPVQQSYIFWCQCKKKKHGVGRNYGRFLSFFCRD
jgi:hypothetical protein